MATRESYDVHIVGFANDIAQARVLEHLCSRAGTRIDDLELPFRIASEAAWEVAERERSFWAHLGATVRITRIGTDARDPAMPVHCLPVRESRDTRFRVFLAGVGVGALVRVTPSGGGRGARVPDADAPRNNSSRRGLIKALVFGVATGVGMVWLAGSWLPQPPGSAPKMAAWMRLSATDPAAAEATPIASLSSMLVEGGAVASAAAAEANNAGVEAARRNDWPTAAQHLREALRLEPDSLLIRRNLQQVLLAWGVEACKSRDTETAIRVLEDARGSEPSAEVAYWLGRAWERHGQLDRAGQVWDDALQAFPTNTQLLLALAEFWEARDNRVRALELFQRAVAAGADVPGLLDRVDRLAREVDAEWEYVVTRSARFDFRHPDSLHPDVLDLVVLAFEAACDHVHTTLGAAPSLPLPVVLYPTEQFYAVTRSPDWAGGAYTGRIQLPVGGLDRGDRARLERVARHELVHALVSQRSRGRAPAWLQEGLAMWGEDDVPGERHGWALEQVRQQPGLTFAHLPETFTRLDHDTAQAAYALSYLAVVELGKRYGPNQLLVLVDASGADDFARAFEQTFGEAYPSAAAEWSRRLR